MRGGRHFPRRRRIHRSAKGELARAGKGSVFDGLERGGHGDGGGVGDERSFAHRLLARRGALEALARDSPRGPQLGLGFRAAFAFFAASVDLSSGAPRFLRGLGGHAGIFVIRYLRKVSA
jgi:hypothetical protein